MLSEDLKHWTGTNDIGHYSINEDIYIPTTSTFELGSTIIEHTNDGDVKLYETIPTGAMQPIKRIVEEELLSIISPIACKAISNGDIRLFRDAIETDIREGFKKVLEEVKEKYNVKPIKP